MNTSRRRRNQSLGEKLAPRHIESILLDWANAVTAFDTPDWQRSDTDLTRLIKKYPEFFRDVPHGPPPPHLKTPDVHRWFVEDVQRFLRLAWDTADLRKREWYIFKARDAYYWTTAIYPIEVALESSKGDGFLKLAGERNELRRHPPALTLFEQVAYHFHRIADRARRCANPECPAPYFFAMKKGQKYCCSKCSGPAQREQKLRWWRKHRGKGEYQ